MYSFEPSDEQKMLIDVIQRYAADDLRPAAHESEESGELAIPLIGKGWDIGTIQASVPDAYGGYGGHSALTGVLALEELAFGDAAGAMAVFSPGLFVFSLLLTGSEEQKSAYLPAVLRGEWTPYTCALVEPRFDFDPSQLSTTAVKNGKAFTITGEKALVPFAAQAEALIVYARLGEETQGFIVPGSSPGLVILERQRTLGLNALPLYRIGLDSLSIPLDHRLGGPNGHPWAPLSASFHLANSALAIGVARAALEYALDYAREREVFGVKVAQKQAIAFMLAEMATELEAARLLTWEAAWMFDQDVGEWQRQAYLADLCSAEMVMMVTDRAVQILGGHGYIREHPVELWMRNGRGFSTLTGLAMV